MKKKKQFKDPSQFDVDKFKCWMFPSNRMDAINAQVEEEERMKAAEKYPKSNAKEVICE